MTDLGRKMIKADIHKKYGMGYFLVAYIIQELEKPIEKR
jgi:hypothetical protein